MNEIKIYLKPSGSTAELYKDFNLYQESYRNVQISIYVPTSILYKDVNNTFLNTVQTGAIITAPNGTKVVTKSFNSNFVKTIMQNNIEYAKYTQIMPKEYALYAGTQIIVCNVVNIDNTDEVSPKIISVVTTQRVPLVVMESAFLSEDKILEPNEAEVIDGLINGLQQQLNEGTFAARAIYPYNSDYEYGVNELVFYPNKGEYGVFLKSLVIENDNPPYTGDGLNSEYWEEITDFNILNELYGLKTDVKQLVLTATEQATAAADSAAQALESEQNAENSAAAAESAKQAAEASATEAHSWADVAKGWAEYGIKINTEYTALDELPDPGDSRYIYLIPNGSTGENSYDEYIWADSKNAYEKIGTTEIDLTAYATKVALEAEATSRQEADTLLSNTVDEKVSKTGDTMTGALKTPKINVDKIARNAADYIYIEPQILFHSQAAFEKNVKIGKVLEVAQIGEFEDNPTIITGRTEFAGPAAFTQSVKINSKLSINQLNSAMDRDETGNTLPVILNTSLQGTGKTDIKGLDVLTANQINLVGGDTRIYRTDENSKQVLNLYGEQVAIKNNLVVDGTTELKKGLTVPALNVDSGDSDGLYIELGRKGTVGLEFHCQRDASVYCDYDATIQAINANRTNSNGSGLLQYVARQHNFNSAIYENGVRVYSPNNLQPIITDFEPLVIPAYHSNYGGYLIMNMGGDGSNRHRRIMICFGMFTTAGTISFAKAYTITPFVMTSPNPSSDMQTQRVAVNTVSTTGFTTVSSGSSYSGKYIAIGEI